jgi:hypothetical protein
MLSTEEQTPTKTAISFAVLSVEPEFINRLVKGSRASLTIAGPEDLTEHLNVSTDTFSLIGFTANRNIAKRLCRKATY